MHDHTKLRIFLTTNQKLWQREGFGRPDLINAQIAHFSETNSLQPICLSSYKEF